jgi:spermidine synthase
MIPWELLDSAQVPGLGATMTLHRRGGEFSIRVGADELMNSRVHGSEDALADLACRRISQNSRPRVLVGGLGMGFTAAAALRRLGPGARVVVAELVPKVVEWNRGILAPLAHNPLQDARVSVREADVAALIREKRGAFDAILLDVDNGPEALTRGDNDWLYSLSGLVAAQEALRPAGVLAVWSAGPDEGFTRRLRDAGYKVEVHPVRSRGLRGGNHHIIWLAEPVARVAIPF